MNDTVLARVASLTDDVPQAIEDLERQRNVIDSQIHQLRRFVTIFDSPPMLQKPTKTKGHGVSQQWVCRLGERILASFPDEPFTIADIRRQMGASSKDSRIYNAIHILRDQEFVGKVGKIPPGRSDLYRVLDADVLDRFRDNGN
jgi:hypothetical protein